MIPQERTFSLVLKILSRQVKIRLRRHQAKLFNHCQPRSPSWRSRTRVNTIPLARKFKIIPESPTISRIQIYLDRFSNNCHFKISNLAWRIWCQISSKSCHRISWTLVTCLQSARWRGSTSRAWLPGPRTRQWTTFKASKWLTFRASFNSSKWITNHKWYRIWAWCSKPLVWWRSSIFPKWTKCVTRSIKFRIVKMIIRNLLTQVTTEIFPKQQRRRKTDWISLRIIPIRWHKCKKPIKIQFYHRMQMRVRRICLEQMDRETIQLMSIWMNSKLPPRISINSNSSIRINLK